MRILLSLLVLPLTLAAQINPLFILKENLNHPKMQAANEGMFGFEQDDKFGYLDKTGKIIIPAVYTYESSTYKSMPLFINGFVVIKKDGKYGLLDKTGKIMIPFEYESMYIVQSLTHHVVASKKEGIKSLFGVITTQNKPAVPFLYDEIRVDSNWVTVRQNNRWGLLDLTGKTLLPFEYSSLTSYTKEKVLKAEKDGRYGFIDVTGKWLFEKSKSVYTLYSCSQGMIQCMVSNKYGFLDLKGNEVIMTRYDNAYSFEPVGLAKVSKKVPSASTVYGYIDKKGTEIIPLKYESLGIFTNGLVSARDPETNRYGYLDKTGKWAIRPVYLEANGFDTHGGAWVKMTDGKFHYISKTGKDSGVLDSINYKFFAKDGLALFEHNEYPYALIDQSGKMIKKIDDCDAIYNFSDGIAGYKSKSTGKYGFLDINGNKIIPAEYDGFSGFNEGICKVDKKELGKTRSGYIDNKGKVVLPVSFDYVYGFRNGWGLVYKDSAYLFADPGGNLKDPPRRYDELYEFRSGYALGKIKGTGNNPHTFYYIQYAAERRIFHNRMAGLFVLGKCCRHQPG